MSENTDVERSFKEIAKVIKEFESGNLVDFEATNQIAGLVNQENIERVFGSLPVILQKDFLKLAISLKPGRKYVLGGVTLSPFESPCPLVEFPSPVCKESRLVILNWLTTRDTDQH